MNKYSHEFLLEPMVGSVTTGWNFFLYKKESCIIDPLVLLLFSRVNELEKIIEHTENTAKVYACYIFTKNLGS